MVFNYRPCIFIKKIATFSDECVSNPCQNHGNCTTIPGGYNCTCLSEFAGYNCEIDLGQLHHAYAIMLHICTSIICNVIFVKIPAEIRLLSVWKLKYIVTVP